MSDIILSSASYIFCSFIVACVFDSVAKLTLNNEPNNPHLLVFRTQNAPKNDGGTIAVKRLML
jgi:hypothetical protein